MADRKQIKSKYTADRQIPGAFEGETVTRRRFMTTTGQVAGGVAAAAFLLPALGFAFGPVFEEYHQPWQVVGTPSDFGPRHLRPADDQARRGHRRLGQVDRLPAPATTRTIDTEPRDQYNAYIAISTSCMHLGCPVHYVNAAQRFICPCHGGVYDFVGKVQGGPPVRPLDRFYTRVANGNVLIGPRFSVNSELQRFSPRDPGEPLDGVGQYLYPSTPDLRKIPNT